MHQKKTKRTRVMEASADSVHTHAHTPSKSRDALIGYYDLSYIDQHAPTWTYVLPVQRKVCWLLTLRTQPLTTKFRESSTYKLQQLIDAHPNDLCLQPEMAPTFCLPEILRQCHVIQHTPLLSANRKCEYWKLYASTHTEKLHNITHVPKIDGHALWYKYIDLKAPDHVVQQLSQVWTHFNESTIQDNGRVDMLLEMNPLTRVESGTIDEQYNKFHIVNLREDIFELRNRIKELYNFYNSIDKTKPSSKLLTMTHISVANQLLDTNGSFFLDLTIGSLFSLHVLKLLCTLFNRVSVFRSYLHLPVCTELSVLCEGFHGHNARTHISLQKCITQLRFIGDTSLDVGFLDVDVLSCRALGIAIQTKNTQSSSYALEYATHIQKRSQRHMNRASLYVQGVVSKQIEIARQLAQRIYRIVLPSLPSLPSPPSHTLATNGASTHEHEQSTDTHICLVHIPGTGTQAVIDMLFSKCHKALSTKQRMVFATKQSGCKCVVESYPYAAAWDYDQNALKMMLCCHPCERASRALSLLLNKMTHRAYDEPLYRLLRQANIERLSDLFVCATVDYPELMHNKILCPQTDYISSNFQQLSCPNTDVYTSSEELLRALSNTLHIALPALPTDEHSRHDLHISRSVQQIIEKHYHRDYIFLRIPTVTEPHPQPQQHTLFLFTSHIPHHPSTTRSVQMSIHKYSNLKPIGGMLLPGLAEKIIYSENSVLNRVSTKSDVQLHYFVHVSRTSGVSLKHALRDMADPINSMCEPPQNLLLQSKLYGKYTRFLSRGHLRARDIDPRISTFAVLRDPLTRFCSAFTFILENIKPSECGRSDNSIVNDLNRIFTEHCIRTVSDIFTLADPTVRANILNSYLFTPMWEFVCDEKNKVIVDHLFLLETMCDVSISEHLRIDRFVRPRKNVSNTKYTLTTEDETHIRQHYLNDFLLYNAAFTAETSTRGKGVHKEQIVVSLK